MDMTTGTQPVRPGPAGPSAAGAARPARPPWTGIALIAAAAVAVEMAVSARYGYVRDELYFLSAGQHLAFGYVDQPPLTPLLARLGGGADREYPGRLPGPARARPRRAGGDDGGDERPARAGRTGQLLAALAAATCSEYLGAMHELTTTTPDFVFWAATLLLVMKLLASQDPRWWVAIGGCAGLASEAKWNIAFLLAALAAGFLLTDARRLLRSRYLLIGALIAAALAAPDLIWQAAHGWPGLEVFRALQGDAGHNRLVYWPAQIFYTGVVLTPLWAAGAAWALRSAAARPFRPVAIACVTVIVLQFVLGGKAYYPGAAFTFLLAAGCVPLERRLGGRRAPPEGRADRPCGGSPDQARVLDSGLLGRGSDGGQRGARPRRWRCRSCRPGRCTPSRCRRSTTTSARRSAGRPWWRWSPGSTAPSRPRSGPGRRSWPATTARRGRSAVTAPGDGLPQAYSGANNFWLWGPPPAADSAAIAVNVDPALLRREFAHVRQVATFRNGLGVDDDEQGAPVFLATGLRSSWARAWPAFRDYG